MIEKKYLVGLCDLVPAMCRLDYTMSEAELMEGHPAEKMKTLQKLRAQMPFWEELHRKNEN